ncbi:MAG: hypothetical protein VXY22_01365 [Pseudomonadota bacterium]|nr:hypothetical protein [Pseudomonadota bacterium]
MRSYKLLLTVFFLFSTAVSSNQIVNDGQQFQKAIDLFQSNKIPEAVQIFKRLSEKNNDSALFYLGKIYYHGDGLEVNKPLAFEYFKRASSNGHRPSLFMLALLYLERCSDFESCNAAGKYLEDSAVY